MITIHKRSLLLPLLAVSAALLLAGLAIMMVGAQAAETVVITTTPAKPDRPVYVETNGNGVNDPDELVGTFDIFDGNLPLIFTWTAYPFAVGENGSYRVSIWQNTTPLAGTPTYAEYKVSHHWAENPNGEMYTMGAFGFGEALCNTCPTIVVVQAETYTLVYNEETQTYEYVYASVEGSRDGVPAMQTSGEFIIEIFRPAPEPSICPHPGIGTCTALCGDDLFCYWACYAIEVGAYEDDYRYDEDLDKCVCDLTEGDCPNDTVYDLDGCVCRPKE